MSALIPGAQGGANIAARMRSAPRPQTSNAGRRYCQFRGEQGVYEFGQAAEDITDETAIIVIEGLAHGHMGFAGRGVRPLKAFAPIDAPLPPPPEADRPDRQFSEARQVPFVLMDELEDGGAPEPIVLEGASVGLCLGADDLITEIMNRCMATEDTIYPVVKLTSRSYDHDAYGKTFYNPVFEILGWANPSLEIEWVGKPQKALPQAEKKPARKAKPEPVAETAAPQGARRRRRKTA